MFLFLLFLILKNLAKGLTCRQMSCRLFCAFFLLFVCCQLCGQGHAANQVQVPGDTGKNTADGFFTTGQEIHVFDSKGEDKTTKITVKTVESINFVAVDGLMVALAEIIKNGDAKIDLLAKFYQIKKGNNWGKSAVENIRDNKWNVQLAAKDLEITGENTVMKSSVVVAEKENAIYFFIFNSNIKLSQPSAPAPSPTVEWKVKLMEGKVTAKSGAEKIIKWTNPKISMSFEDSQLKEKLGIELATNVPSDGFAFVNGDKKYIAFVLENAKATSSNSNKYIITVFQLEGNGNEKTLKFFAENIVDCYPSFFKWEEKIIIMPIDYPKNCKKNVMLFDANEKNKFAKSDSPIAYLKDFLKDKQNFVTAKIKEKNVLLFTEQKSEDERSDAHLWMTDGTRVGYVGTVVGGFRGTFYGSILHTDGELFALYQNYATATSTANAKNIFSFRHLKNQLDQITLLLQKWEKSIETVSELCKNSEASDYKCTTSLPTDGLVGFLHSTISERNTKKEWEDGCYYSNVIVENGEKVPNGFKFSGEKKGAKWIMKSQTGDQPYSFTDPGFTLAAAVTIGSGTSGSHNSIFGAGLTVDTKNVGLWCTTGGKWGVMVGKDEKKITLSSVACESGKKYYVLFTLDGTDISVYVNGRQLPGLTNNKIEKKEKITHFYFGADNDLPTLKKTDVTITDVLLYNRPLKTKEIEKFKLRQNDETDIKQKDENDTSAPPNLDDSTIKTDGPLDTSATEADGAKTKSRLFSMNSAALLSLLFGLFPLLGRYV